MDLIDETFFLPRLMRLQECVCEELEKAGGPSLCFCGLVPAGRPPLGLMDCRDTKACGVAWVAPTTVFSSTSFPLPDEDALACNAPLAMGVQIGVARCHPRPGRGKATLDPQDTFEAVRLYMSDMAAVKRALLCCFPKSGGNVEYLSSATSWEPIDPEADASGGVWTGVIG